MFFVTCRGGMYFAGIEGRELVFPAVGQTRKGGQVIRQ